MVDALIALAAPPITPASAIAPLSSAITRFDGFNSYVSPFSAAIVSPGKAERTRIGPASLSASNACIG